MKSEMTFDEFIKLKESLPDDDLDCLDLITSQVSKEINDNLKYNIENGLISSIPEKV